MALNSFDTYRHQKLRDAISCSKACSSTVHEHLLFMTVDHARGGAAAEVFAETESSAQQPPAPLDGWLSPRCRKIRELYNEFFN